MDECVNMRRVRSKKEVNTEPFQICSMDAMDHDLYLLHSDDTSETVLSHSRASIAKKEQFVYK